MCLVAEDGVDAALMPVKMTTHRLHTSYATVLSMCLFRLAERRLKRFRTRESEIALLSVHGGALLDCEFLGHKVKLLLR